MAVDARVSEYLLELLRCGVNDTIPSEKPEGVSWEAVYAFAKRHSVSALAFYALRTRKDELPAALAEKWEEQNAMLLTKYVNQEHELTKLSQGFEREKIPYMPLKGSCMRDLYPSPHQREMSDLDILIREEDVPAAISLAQSMGYKVESESSHHVELLKKPFMCLELHSNLVPSDSPFYKYYHRPWELAHPVGDGFRYVMNRENFYLYMLVHTAKHYYWCGTGIRSVVDVFLFNRAYRTELDLGYIKVQLEKLQLTDFAKQIEALAERWFGDAAENARESCDTDEMQHYLLTGTTYGMRANFAQNMVHWHVSRGKSVRAAKTTMYLSMVFLPLTDMKKIYPVLKKAPFLLPFCWVARWIRILIKSPGTVTAQYRRVADIELYGTHEDKK